MFLLKKLYCRAFQLSLRAMLPFLPYREPKIIGSAAEVSSVLEGEGARSVLIVSGKTVLKNGLLSALENSLTESKIKYKIFAERQPDPTTDNIEHALAAYIENECDSIIAVGGGSALDCAKILGARVAYPKKSIGKMKGVLKIRRKIPTLIAIPTTAGSGSEVTPAAVVTDSETHHKYAVMSFPLIPKYAVLDAAMTYTLPKGLTATTGMDALTHAVEAYIGRSTTRETRLLASESVKLIFENLYAAYSDGNNAAARENMLLASYKSGIAFSKSYVGYVHAVAHSIGGKYGVPHGLANAVILPSMLEYYGKSVYKKLYRLAVFAGLANETDSYETAAKKFISAIRELNEKMEIPQRIASLRHEDIKELAATAEKEANPLYPVPKLLQKNELETFYNLIGEYDEKN